VKPARGVDLDAGRFEFGGTNEGAGVATRHTLDTSAIEHLITAGPAHSDRGDGGTLCTSSRRRKAHYSSRTLGRRWRAWVSFLSDARKGSGMRATDAYWTTPGVTTR